MPAIRNNGAAGRRAEGTAVEHSTTHNANQALAFPRGPWILRSKAQEEFLLATLDLDSILPISIEPNPHGGPFPMTKYNWCDVRNLANRLRPTFGPDDRAEEDGPAIDRNNAMWRYKLKDCQIDRVKPTVIDGNITHYNEKDVRALAEKIRYAAAHPTGQPRPANYVPSGDFNVFSGISNQDADEWLYRLTGIAGGYDDYDGYDDYAYDDAAEAAYEAATMDDDPDYGDGFFYDEPQDNDDGSENEDGDGDGDEDENGDEDEDEDEDVEDFGDEE